MSYSCNDNQNYFVADGKTTSRVLAPPGGKTSFSLAWDDEPEEQPAKAKQVVQAEKKENPQSLASTEQRQSVEQAKMEPEPTIEKKTEEKNGEMQPRVESSSTKNIESKETTSTFRPSSRVLAPPGGKTSIVLG